MLNKTSGLPGPEEGQARLLKMRAAQASGLLVLMVALLGVARIARQRVPALEWLEAFCEAALVGGLADWFAVVALFRHPLGLRWIPHTAILEARRAQIAGTMGAFIAQNFLRPSVLDRWLSRVDLLGLAGGWVQKESPKLAGQLCDFLPRMLEILEEGRAPEFVRAQVLRQMEALPLAPFAGRVLGWFTSGGKHELLLDELLQLVERLLVEHRLSIEASIRRELPGSGLLELVGLDQPVVEWIASKILNNVRGFLEAAALDRSHPVRMRFNERVERLIVELQSSPEYLRKGEEIKRELLASPGLRQFASEVWSDLCRTLAERAADPVGGFRVGLAQWIGSVVSQVASERGLSGCLNDLLRSGLVQMVESQQARVAELIAEEVRSWSDMGRRLELEVGADLQFIRINGTLIGGLIGVLIHAVSRLGP